MVDLLEGRDVSSTVGDLGAAGALPLLFQRVRLVPARRRLTRLLGAELRPEARAMVEPEVAALGIQWELQFNLGRLGLTAGAPAFDPSPFSSLVSGDPTAPFTGAGATGGDQRNLRIPLLEKIALARGVRPAMVRYSNPISSSGSYASLRGYLSTLTRGERVQQARLLLSRPLTSAMAESYDGSIPSRAQAVFSAGCTHKLRPSLLAAFLLAEQRDQSCNEDAAEYSAAVSLIGADTSIGLGQLRVSSVARLDLFADLLFQRTRERLNHKETAFLLVSEEFNIFATARCLRSVADRNSRLEERNIPNTRATFPGLALQLYSKDSAEWPEDNLRAIASMYTGTPVGDRPVRDWAEFVVEALRDVEESGCL